MSYRRNFTIGRRETRNFYLTLVLGSWRKGIAGFGAVGALAALLYMPALSLPLRGLLLLAGAAAGMGLSTLFLAVSTCLRVRAQLRRSGRERYVQQTEIDGFGVRVTVGKDRARLTFEKLVRVRETRRAFYLFLSQTQAWILPKNQMEDRDEECRQIRRIFHTVVEKGRLKLKK